MNADYGKLPVRFEANQGQTAGDVHFLARGNGYGLFLTPTESVLVLRKPRSDESRGPAGRRDVAGAGRSEPPAVLRMKLLGASPRPKIVGRDELPGKSHYFIGNDPKRWRTDVPQFARVEYQDVYPHVNLMYYGNQNQLEYDFVVSPGGDPRRIRLGIEGADAVHVDRDGNLVLRVAGSEVVQKAPVVYQEFGAARKSVSGRFVVRGRSEVGFEVGSYAADRPLVLDPVLVYSTFLGGSGSDRCNAIAVDASGNAYVTGGTGSTDFPTAGPLQAASAGGGDAFVAKLNAEGTALVYATYLGGSGQDFGLRIAVDPSGNAYMAGTTASTNFPTVHPLQGAYGGGSQDLFVAKLSADGSALVYSTYLGGTSTDYGFGIDVDASGSAYLTGWTFSTNFPTVNPLQAVGVVGDAFVAKVNAEGSALVYSTYLGGSNGAEGTGIAVDSSGNAYVTGQTFSTDFPTVNPLQAARGGDYDGFVSKVNAAGSALVYSTYLGGAGGELPLGIAVDTTGAAYVAGRTSSSDFPTVNPVQAVYGGGMADAFVSKVNAAGSALVYSTYLGGDGFDQGGIAVNPSGSAYVTGWTQSTNFPTTNPFADRIPFQNSFVAQLDTAGSRLVYSSYLGGAFADGIAVDGSGNAYVSGGASSPNFPTFHPLQPAYGGGSEDAFVTKIGPAPPADFNGDRNADIFWRNQSGGDDIAWFMDGTTLAGGAVLTQVGDPNWQIVATPDFNADGKPDILWRHRVTGDNLVWFMNGTTIASSTVLTPVSDTNWQIVATADLDSDGQADILWRNQATGDDVVWFMNGTSIKGGASLTPVTDTRWTIVGAADFNADGKPDVLWRNQASGDNVVWFMDGVAIAGGAVLMPVADVNWVVGAVGDYNANGKPDIVWRNQASGGNVVWFMDGATISGGAVLPSVSDADWRIVGPR
jgi:hypothetical protein